MNKKDQEEKVQILKELVNASEYSQKIKDTLNNLLAKVEVTEKTAQEESINSLVNYICYSGMDRATKKESYYMEMKTLIGRIDYCYKYLNI